MVQKRRKRSLVLIIHNVRSALNVGALFRTADGAGVKRIFLTGYTPCPHLILAGSALSETTPTPNHTRYLTRAEKAIKKTALGAEEWIAWEKSVSCSRILAELRKTGFTIVALEQNEKSMDYRKYVPQVSVALVIGNEVRGVDAKILKQCDAIIEIPMHGKKNSLNVSVACGIALYQIMSTMRV